MTSQYFVATALPALQIGAVPEISFADFITLVNENLPPREKEKIEVIRRLIDLYNLVAYWRGMEIDPRGSLSVVELQEAVQFGEGLPDYVLEFLDEHEGNEARLHAHGELVAHFFQREIERAGGFLHRYLVFERNWRLVMVGLRAAHLKRELAVELQYEDPTDTLVMQLLTQRDAKSFEPPEGYEELKVILDDSQGDPLRLHLELERLRFEWVRDLVEGELFSIDWILGYCVRLMIAEKWQELHEQQN